MQPCYENSVVELLLSNLHMAANLTDLMGDGERGLSTLNKWGLKTLDVSSNSLTGTISPSVTILTNLTSLNLAYNCEYTQDTKCDTQHLSPGYCSG